VTARKKDVTVERAKTKQRIPEWRALHFSLANPEGRGRERVPRLLNRLAAEIRTLGQVEVLDITFHTDVDEGGNVPHFTVYYYRPSRTRTIERKSKSSRSAIKRA